MYSGVNIANYFIEKSFDQGNLLTPMQVLKLAYIAHGWYLATQDEPLLSEAVQAWKYGPVVPSVYRMYKDFGRDEITSTRFNPALRDEYSDLKSDANTIDVLDRVYMKYGCLDGLQLSALTHAPDTPWDITWNHSGGNQREGVVIPNNLIKDHYKQKAIENRRRAANKQ